MEVQVIGLVGFILLCFAGYFLYVMAAYSAHKRRLNAIKKQKEEAREKKERARQQRLWEKQQQLEEERRIAEERRLEVLRREDPKAYEKEMYRKWVLEQQGLMNQYRGIMSTSMALNSYMPQSMVSYGSLQSYQNAMNQYNQAMNQLQAHKNLLRMYEAMDAREDEE